MGNKTTLDIVFSKESDRISGVWTSPLLQGNGTEVTFRFPNQESRDAFATYMTYPSKQKEKDGYILVANHRCMDSVRSFYDFLEKGDMLDITNGYSHICDLWTHMLCNGVEINYDEF